jgi:hypothetical protein
VPAGFSIYELMDYAEVPSDRAQYITVFNCGSPIKDWNYVAKEGDNLTFAVIPQGKGGGGQIIAAIAMIALAVIAPWAGGMIAGMLGFSSTGLVASAIGLGITLVGTMLMQALIPPASVANTAKEAVASPLQESPTYTITGQSNQSRKYSVIPRIYGQHKFFPNIASTPLIETVGTASKITALYAFGYGNIVVYDLKVGDLPLEVLSPQYRWHQNSTAAQLQYVTRSVSYDQLNYKLEQNEPLIINTKDQCVHAVIDITFPKGLVRYDTSSNRSTQAVSFNIQYRRQGSNDPWTRLPGNQFLGVDVDKELYTYSAVYDPNNMWRTEQFNGGSHKWSKNIIIRNDAEVNMWHEIVYGSTDGAGHTREVFINGISYRKGIQRDADTPNAKWSFQFSDLQIGRPVPKDGTTVSAATGQPIVASLNFYFPTPAVYEIKITRLTQTSTANTIYDESFMTLIKSFRSQNVLRLQKPHTMLELVIVASDKVTGVVQNLSGMAISALRWHDGNSWQPAETTRNPVWIVIDILTGIANKTPLRDDQLDMPSWLRLAAICDQTITTVVNGVTYYTPRYTCDVVVDFSSTVQEIVSSILSICRSQLIITQSGKYGVMIDEEKQYPRQMFTPENSWGFSGNRSFVDRPHGLRTKFMSPELNWQVAEFTVYDDGYGPDNSTLFDDLATFGITNYPQAYRYARYMLAQGLHRSEIFSLQVDIENLAVQRGELVLVAHDVPMVGGAYARVMDVREANVFIDQVFGTLPPSYTVRQMDGSIRSGAVKGSTNDGWIELDGTWGIEEGCLIVFGNPNRVTGSYLVQEITPAANLTAELKLVPYVPDIYLDGPIPPWDPQFGDEFTQSDLSTKFLVNDYTIVYKSRMPFGQSRLAWQTSGYNLFTHSVVVRPVGTDRWTSLGSTPDHWLTWEIDLLQSDWAGKDVEFQVTPISRNGEYGTPAHLFSTLERDTTPPKKPAHFSVNVQAELVEMFWEASDEPDIDYYDIRYTPEVWAPAWTIATHLSRVGWNTTHTSAGARTGTYLIRAVDTSGNRGEVAMMRTTVAQLPDINIVETIDESLTGWKGSKSGLVQVGSSLFSAGNWGSVYPEGVYTFAKVLDLGQVYEARVSSMIKAYGVRNSDFMEFWQPLSSVPALARTDEDEWDAWLEISTSDEQMFMSEWEPNLEALSSMSSASDAKWSPWRAVQVGDFTGQLYRFRIVARSYDPDVKVVIMQGKVLVDMPDRFWASSDIEIPVSGRRIFFDPAFRAPPTLAVTIDGNISYVTAVVTKKTHLSFDLRLMEGATGNPAAGKVDVMAKGYGRLRATSI